MASWAWLDSRASFDNDLTNFTKKQRTGCEPVLVGEAWPWLIFVPASIPFHSRTPEHFHLIFPPFVRAAP